MASPTDCRELFAALYDIRRRTMHELDAKFHASGKQDVDLLLCADLAAIHTAIAAVEAEQFAAWLEGNDG